MPKKQLHLSIGLLLAVVPALACAQHYPDCPATINNFHQCERHKEAQILKREPAIAKRQGGRLTIALENGKGVVLVDRVPKGEDDSDVALYSLSKIFYGTRYVEVSVTPYEGVERYLVNRTTGERTAVTGMTLLSPDAKRIVVWSDDVASDSFLRVYRVDGPVLLVEFQATNTPPSLQNVRWLTNSEVAFQDAENQDADFRLTAARIAGPPTGWRLTSTSRAHGGRR